VRLFLFFLCGNFWLLWQQIEWKYGKFAHKLDPVITQKVLKNLYETWHMGRWQSGNYAHFFFFLCWKFWLLWQQIDWISRILIWIFTLFHYNFFIFLRCLLQTLNITFFLVINHIICDKVYNSSKKIIRITSLELRIFMKIMLSFLNNFFIY
jgi:hypothetical protein